MTNDKGQIYAIVAYITIIGWIIALILNLNQKRKYEFASFHIRQALMIMIAMIILVWIPVIGKIIGVVLFIFWLIGLVTAIQGKKYEAPLIGKLAQDWFKGL